MQSYEIAASRWNAAAQTWKRTAHVVGFSAVQKVKQAVIGNDKPVTSVEAGADFYKFLDEKLAGKTRLGFHTKPDEIKRFSSGCPYMESTRGYEENIISVERHIHTFTLNALQRIVTSRKDTYRIHGLFVTEHNVSSVLSVPLLEKGEVISAEAEPTVAEAPFLEHIADEIELSDPITNSEHFRNILDEMYLSAAVRLGNRPPASELTVAEKIA